MKECCREGVGAPLGKGDGARGCACIADLSDVVWCCSQCWKYCSVAETFYQSLSSATSHLAGSFLPGKPRLCCLAFLIQKVFNGGGALPLGRSKLLQSSCCLHQLFCGGQLFPGNQEALGPNCVKRNGERGEGMGQGSAAPACCCQTAFEGWTVMFSQRFEFTQGRGRAGTVVLAVSLGHLNLLERSREPRSE